MTLPTQGAFSQRPDRKYGTLIYSVIPANDTKESMFGHHSTGNVVTDNDSSWWLLGTLPQTSVLSQVHLEEVCFGGPKLNYHIPGLAAVYVWGPIWVVPWIFLLMCFQKLVLCSRNSRVRHFFKTETWKENALKNWSHFVQLRLKTYWSL